MFTDDFADMGLISITVANLSGRDDYGGPSYSAETTYSARWVQKTKLVKARDGSEVLSSHHLWMNYVESLTPESRFTLPDGSTPDILSIEKFRDESGPYSMKVYFQ